MIIEKDDGPLSEWVLVTAHGKDMIGIPLELEKGILLKPVYQLIVQMQLVQDKGQIQQVKNDYQVWPIYFLFTLNEITVPRDSLIVPMSKISKMEREKIASSLEKNKVITQRIRKAIGEPGVEIVQGMPANLPISGRRG